ncbi:MAG: TolC family protein [Sphaerochaeta sp.]
MKRHLLSMLLIMTFFFPVHASYPNVEEIERPQETLFFLEESEVQAFLENWKHEGQMSASDLLETLRAKIQANDWQLKQLSDVVNIQLAQLEFSLSQGRPTWGVSATPYTYTDMLVQTAGARIPTKSHAMQVEATLSDTLASGGTLQVSAQQKSVYSISTLQDAWTQTPSVSLSFRQPLWIADGILDRSYQEKQVEKQRLALQSAEYSKEELEQVLLLQNLRLLLLRQSLLENRYVLSGRVALSKEAVQRAFDDLEAGLISSQAYERTQFAYQQNSNAYDSVVREIEQVQVSLRRLFQQDAVPLGISLEGADVLSLSQVVEDWEGLLSRYLSQDPGYQQARLEFQSAALDSGMFSPSDAPSLQIQFQVSPSYTPSDGNTFFSSFSEMVGDADPQLSFSITFSASDLFRKSSSLQHSVSESALSTAKAGLEIAYREAEDAVLSLQRQVTQYLSELQVAFADYQLKEAVLSSEQIRYEASISDKQSLRQMELDWYQAAFTVLSALRELEFLSLQMKMQGLLV